MKTSARLLLLVGLSVATSAHASVTIDWVTVGDVGNVADSTGYGSVAYEYQISKYEVTNAQYAEFLNVKGASDPNALYNTSMGSDARGGITRSGSSGSYSYSVKSGYENMPVVYVSHLDAQRFSNWMNNGQGAANTETGAYTVGSFATHSSTSNVWIPTEHEWYKAAYYQPVGLGGDTDSYWLYPTKSNTQPTSATPPSAITGAANYNDVIANGINGGYAVTQSTSFSGTTNYLSNVGAYSNSSSFYGTFDQGGNVWEWNDAVLFQEDDGGDALIGGKGTASLTVPYARGLRGGSWTFHEFGLRALLRGDLDPPFEDYNVGFRLASSAVPEPSRFLLLLAGLGALLLRRRR